MEQKLGERASLAEGHLTGDSNACFVTVTAPSAGSGGDVSQPISSTAFSQPGLTNTQSLLQPTEQQSGPQASFHHPQDGPVPPYISGHPEQHTHRAGFSLFGEGRAGRMSGCPRKKTKRKGESQSPPSSWLLGFTKNPLLVLKQAEAWHSVSVSGQLQRHVVIFFSLEINCCRASVPLSLEGGLQE